MSKITLYHGTLSLFDAVDVSRGKGYKDFGKGFYLTGDKTHATRLAERNKQIEIRRRELLQLPKIEIPMYLYTFEFDMSLLADCKLNVREFMDTEVTEWVEFVLANRVTATKSHDYDIVIGATADDDTRLSLQVYRLGGYGDVNSDVAKNALIAALKVDVYPVQTYFGTQLAADKLVFIERTEI